MDMDPGWFITIGIVIAIFGGGWIIYSIEEWDRYLTEKTDRVPNAWIALFQLIFVKPILVISFLIIIILTIVGMYSAATATRDWWHKK